MSRDDTDLDRWAEGDESSGEEPTGDDASADASAGTDGNEDGATTDATGDTEARSDTTDDTPDEYDQDLAGGRATAIDRPDSRAETVELGVDLLAGLADDELSVKHAVDRIETVTTDPDVTREILDTAEVRGVIDRDDATIQTTGGTPIRLDRRVYRREGDFECRRCGASLSTGHFVRLDAGDLGPFGSSCIRKVTGRD